MSSTDIDQNAYQILQEMSDRIQQLEAEEAELIEFIESLPDIEAESILTERKKLLKKYKYYCPFCREVNTIRFLHSNIYICVACVIKFEKEK